MNTIFAQCSAAGKAGVTVFRISGPSAASSLEKISKLRIKDIEPRKVYLTKIYDFEKNSQIDEAVVVYFKGESSFTGEDTVEIFAHGSLAVVKMMNRLLAKQEDLRLAEPGEFSKRSFINGKMDLTAAEGLADLLDAETELQHKQAIRQLGGSLQKVYDSWRKDLLAISALVEAYIDFPDEDIPEEIFENTENSVKKLILNIESHLDDDNRGERLRNGIKLAILGKPNVGKSSLLNFLMQREIAIVSNIAGTTRDVIEGHLDIGGYPVILQDTAGIRHQTDDVIEQEGINRAINTAKDADIKIIVYDNSSDADEIKKFKELVDDNSIILFNKSDISESKYVSELKEYEPIILSIKNKIGTDLILKRIISIAERIARPSESPQITRARYRSQLEKAISYLTRFSMNNDLVLAAEDVRMAIRSIDNITGKISVDEILGEIFSNFCIGK